MECQTHGLASWVSKWRPCWLREEGSQRRQFRDFGRDLFQGNLRLDIFWLICRFRHYHVCWLVFKIGFTTFCCRWAGNFSNPFKSAHFAPGGDGGEENPASVGSRIPQRLRRMSIDPSIWRQHGKYVRKKKSKQFLLNKSFID